MALINCPDCKTEVSSLAAACPKCARPIAAPATSPESPQQKTQTIEATAKDWKAIQLLGALILCFSFGAFAVHDTAKGSVLLFSGIVVLVVGMVGAWWHHG